MLLAGCFDRIIVSLAMIAAFQLGMPRSVTCKDVLVCSLLAHEVFCKDSTWDIRCILLSDA
jgi:hypothetical protein